MSPAAHPIKVLLTDDEEPFRSALAERLRLRGFVVIEAADGEEAVRRVRKDRGIDVVVLDKKMPGMDGPRTLQEIKGFRPEIQVVILTAYGSVDSAAEAGRLGAFKYLTKPVAADALEEILRAAAREKVHALSRHDMPHKRPAGLKGLVMGSANSRPLVILLGALVMLASWLIPPADGLVALLHAPKTGDLESDPIGGYPEYHALPAGRTIAWHFVDAYRPAGVAAGDEAPVQVARRAQLMIGLILTAAMFWASGAVPLGVTALMIAAVMYAGGVMRPDGIAQAFAKDSVVFIFGVLVLSRVIMATGLDRRIAMLLLGRVRNLAGLIFLFLPAFSLACAFISETILIALMVPLFLKVYHEVLREQGMEAATDANRGLLVMLILALCFASNVGGPGSPAAGARNAVMIGILADYGQAPSFGRWLAYGMPFVPVAALGVGAYMYAAFRRRIARELPRRLALNVGVIARGSSRRLGPMNRDEYVTAATALLVVAMWIWGGERMGMGGPVLVGMVVLNVLGVMKWSQVTKIPWDVVFMYAGASALGKGLAVTGGALYLAKGFIGLLPAGLVDGSAFGGALGDLGLPMATSLMAGVVTNFMSDGATVAAIGPITVPMAHSAGIHPWLVGFATSFASSFAHALIIGTPGNALAYILCKDPRTGRHLVTQRDFLRHGTVAFLISMAVLWLWTFMGYWRWLGSV